MKLANREPSNARFLWINLKLAQIASRISSHPQFNYNQLHECQRKEEHKGAYQVETEMRIRLLTVHGLPGRIAIPHGQRLQLCGWPQEVKIETFTLRRQQIWFNHGNALWRGRKWEMGWIIIELAQRLLFPSSPQPKAIPCWQKSLACCLFT